MLGRTTREALANLSKHARASLVAMSIRNKDDLAVLKIHDNGKGFDFTKSLRAGRVTRSGLLVMRERLEMVGETLEIDSNLHQGATIRTQLPFDVREA